MSFMRLAVQYSLHFVLFYKFITLKKVGILNNIRNLCFLLFKRFLHIIITCAESTDT